MFGNDENPSKSSSEGQKWTMLGKTSEMCFFMIQKHILFMCLSSRIIQGSVWLEVPVPVRVNAPRVDKDNEYKTQTRPMGLS